MTVLNIVESFSQVMNTGAVSANGERVQQVREKSPEAKMPVHPEKDAGEVVEELNRLTGSFNEKVKFSFHEKTNRIIIKVIDADTNEVVREIPAKYSLRLLEHFQEHMGLFIDESR